MRAAGESVGTTLGRARGCTDTMLDTPMRADTLNGLEKALLPRGWPYPVPSPQPGRRRGFFSNACSLSIRHALTLSYRHDCCPSRCSTERQGSLEGTSANARSAAQRRRCALRPKFFGSFALMGVGLGAVAAAKDAHSKRKCSVGRTLLCRQYQARPGIGRIRPPWGVLPTATGARSLYQARGNCPSDPLQPFSPDGGTPFAYEEVASLAYHAKA